MSMTVLIMLAITAPQQERVAQGIATKDYGKAAQRHFNVLVEHFGLEGFYSRPSVATIPEGKVKAEDISPYIRGTGLHISVNGKSLNQSDPGSEELIWDGKQLLDREGNGFVLNGKMVVDLLVKQGAKVEIADKLSVYLRFRRYMTEWDVWSDSIQMSVFIDGGHYVVEINDNGKYRHAYKWS
jgi:hypothetical protein